MGTFSQYQYPHTRARYAECARFCGIQAKDDEEAVKKLIEKIEALKKAVGIKPPYIKDYGIDEKDFLDRLGIDGRPLTISVRAQTPDTLL